jgi:DNA-binding HxlR family transcriptional regulator
MVTAIFAASVVFLLCVIAHVVAMRLRPTKNRVAAITWAFLPGFPLTVIVVFLLHRIGGWPARLDGPESPMLAYVFALILHLLLFFLFVECFSHIERSVTLRLLVELLEHPKGAATTVEIMREYSVDDMIRRRLADLLRNGWVQESDGRFRLTEKGRRLARVMSVSIWIYQSKPQNERL